MIGGSGVIDIGTPLPIYFAAAAAAALDPHPYARLVARSLSLRTVGKDRNAEGAFVVVVGVVADKEGGGNEGDWRRQGISRWARMRLVRCAASC
ncbi:MAG: hypothetical protein J0L63_08370 [Anaerolineae bacterium]|nr:hypothetical protein [Anaerolineae bacterium]